MRRKKRKYYIAALVGMLLVIGVWIVSLVITDRQVELSSVEYEQVQKTFLQVIKEYEQVIDEFNVVIDEYERMQQITSLENIKGMPMTPMRKVSVDWEMTELVNVSKRGDVLNGIIEETSTVREEVYDLLMAIRLARQITNPSEEWVLNRLTYVDGILDMQSVTMEHDPNHLLGKEGGYTSCVYFSLEQIEQNAIEGDDVVAKGTDAGGAVEVYATLEDATIRCEYLKQFDNTLLYAGSYALIGTMVVRTSYCLSNEEQIAVTEKIVYEFTTLRSGNE